MNRRVRRAIAPLCVVVLCAAAAACGPGSADPKKPSPSASASASPTPSVADTKHAVKAPGPLKERLHGDDMLIYSQDSLSESMVQQIQGIKGVVATEQLSLAQVSVRERAIVVAAVNPATYRRWTPPNSAQTLEIWERVAGGELALPAQLGQELQQQDAFLQLGNDKTAPTLHIGAYADQSRRIDAVVNVKWGKTLGMIEGNALLINTGIRSPQSVRPEIQRIVGARASVMILGPDLDTSVAQTAFLTGGSVARAVGGFSYFVSGKGGHISIDPAWVRKNIRTEKVPILGSITCHSVMFPQLRAALTEIVKLGLADKIYQTAGCFNQRFIANTTHLSNHAFGIAIDLNSLENQRGTVGQMDPQVVKIFKKWGFAWGGDWAWTDPMHFEMNAIVKPR